MPTTDEFGWTVPTVGGSAGTWGDELNDLFDDDIEGTVKTVKDTADAALPKAGGTMTGSVDVKTALYTPVNKGNLSGAVTFDLDAANVFYGTVTGAVTSVTFSGLTSGKAEFWVIEITNGATANIAWPSSVKWDGGTAPTLQTSGVDVLVFYSRDGGTTIHAVQAMSHT